jgi:DNA-binding GntR family transcriptional regulator
MSQMLQIHDQLREMILSLDLTPGERLTERWLESRFEGSRTPIRAALVRLEGEELVRRDGRNWIVAPIDLGELEALAEFREPLETNAVRLACARANEADIAAIEGMLDACQSAPHARNGIGSAPISMSRSHACRATRSSLRRSRG